MSQHLEISKDSHEKQAAPEWHVLECELHCEPLLVGCALTMPAERRFELSCH